MRAHRVLFLLLAMMAALAVPAAASAAPGDYPAPNADVSVNTGTTSSNGSVTFSGSGYDAGERVQITVRIGGRTYVLKTVRADANGNFSTSVSLSGYGQATLTATGLRSGVSRSTTVQVLGDTNYDSLPVTGDSSGPLKAQLASGAGAVLAGTAMVWWTIRRRRIANAG